jgi:DNA-binding beta-propeller fold protein YncE
LRALEDRYPNHLAVVGVHSGKYIAERETSRIRDASIRLGAIHPVVNDRQFRLWRAYAVRAWPTLVAIDPRGAVVGMQAGEFTADALAPFLDRLIDASRSAGTLVERPLEPFAADAPTAVPSTLCFPGKVALDGRRIAIADSGNQRVLVGVLDDSGTRMRVEQTVGAVGGGYRDGTSAAFVNPQGLLFRGDLLYVADAGSHTVRELALESGVTRTIAGTGRQLRSAVDEARGALSSPWDLAVTGDTLHVAMAGVHQLWTVALATGRVEVLSGSGAEELRDGPHGDAALAQPMGLCADDALYVADAESSAVRVADGDPAGVVRTIVGTGLFDFGDVDGEGDAVRLQHPQGIARASDGRLLVCDSYNDALKWVDPASRRAERWMGGLHEPAGLAIGERAVYVADTNAHRVAVIDRTSRTLRPLSIE